MKKLTATYPDDAAPDLAGLMAVSIEFSIETIDQAAAKGTKKIHKPGGGRNSVTTLMEHYSPQATFSFNNAMSWIKAAGYAKNTAYTAIFKATKAGHIRDLGDHQYQFAKPLPKVAS